MLLRGGRNEIKRLEGPAEVLNEHGGWQTIRSVRIPCVPMSMQEMAPVGAGSLLRSTEIL